MCDVWGPQEGRVAGEVMLAVRKGLPPPQLREAAGVPPPDTEEAKVLPSTASCLESDSGLRACGPGRPPSFSRSGLKLGGHKRDKR